jgi:hypothetical protein
MAAEKRFKRLIQFTQPIGPKSASCGGNPPPQSDLPSWTMRSNPATYWINGREYVRVAYGDESSDWGADKYPCGDCGVEKGQFHRPWCDIERCPACDRQHISCACEWDEDEYYDDDEGESIH